ncbi:hypothetical protein IBT54_002975 [Pantoea sp. S62]|nr:hypothetical protein [Pantoea sp. S62]
MTLCEQAQEAYAFRKDAKDAINGPLCFATGVCSRRFEFWCRLNEETLSDQDDLPDYQKFQSSSSVSTAFPIT